MHKTAHAYAQENAAKALAAEKAAKVRGDAKAVAYWQGYRVALDALIDQIDRRTLHGLY